MSSATLTDQRGGFQPWHIFLLLSMGAATVAVVLARETHPAALLLLSAAVVATGLTAWAIFNALRGFFGLRLGVRDPLPESAEQALRREKAHVLRAIKELEFDKAMGKVSEADFAVLHARLRLRAMALIEDLERAPRRTSETPGPQTRAERTACAACGTSNEPDAKFCKSCGGRL
jgi:hypothetical protein